ncbi:MAG: sulfatase [Actinomycetota bacterium]|nr:sulfatase [Actinomycetota bacterium]
MTTAAKDDVGAGNRAGRSFGAAIFLGLACAAIALFPGGGEAAKKPKKQKRPNIVFVMTDDQSAEQQRFMPKTNALLDKGGVNFTNNFVTYPLCCPSRSTWLTGQYPHNHGVRTNTPPAGGYSKLDKSNTLPVSLQRAGYRTAHIGKFLNGYGTTSPDTEVPPGWSEWYGSLDDPDAYTGGTYTMYGYTLNENGSVVHYGSTPDVVDPATYQTDVYSAKAADFIRRNAPGAKPFFLSVAPLASHSEAGAFTTPDNNPRAAPRHEGTLASSTPPTKPSFNETDVSDKPQSVQDLALMTPLQQQGTRDRYRARAESLLAVDEMMQNIADTLKAKGELKNTVIIYTSDNGFFHGEHRVRQGKVRLYEESIRVPLLIRGPGIPKGKNRAQPVGNVDLAPTIADFANARPLRRADGRTLVPLAADKLFSPGRPIGLEAFFQSDPDDDPEAPPTNYQAVRTDRYLYAEYGTGEQELYDLYSDPFELQSRHLDPGLTAVKGALDRLLARTANCDGKGCAARPALKLKLSFADDDGCVAGSIGARLAGGDADEVELGRFYAGKRKAGQDGSGAIEGKIGAKLLSGARKNPLTVNATMLDGRIATVKAVAPRAC